MDIDQLRLFVEVCRRGSCAEVARDRGVDPDLVLRGVAALETELGFALFDRDAEAFAVSAAGEAYAAQAEIAVEALAKARQAALERAESTGNVLRVGVPESFAQLGLGRLLPGFLADHPDLRIELQPDAGGTALAEGSVDLAIRLGPQPEGDAVCEKVAAFGSRACASPEYLERCGRPARPEDLAGHDGLKLAAPPGDAPWIFRDPDGGETEVRPRSRVGVANLAMLAQLARDGCGVVLLGDWVVHQDLRLGALVDLFPDHRCSAGGPIEASVWALRPAGRGETAPLRAFLDRLTAGFASAPWNPERSSGRAPLRG